MKSKTEDRLPRKENMLMEVTVLPSGACRSLPINTMPAVSKPAKNRSRPGEL